MTDLAISRNDDEPLVLLKNFRLKHDGTSDCDISYDQPFLDLAKASYKVETLDKQQVSGFVNQLIEKATSGLDGYKLKRV